MTLGTSFLEHLIDMCFFVCTEAKTHESSQVV